MSTPAIDRARRYSEERLDALRAALPAALPPDIIVVACGSFARHEASPASDFDYFVIAPEGDEAGWAKRLRESIEPIVKVAPASDGAFGKVETLQRMVRNIGGQGDDNQKLTRRMLFLLEGTPVHGETGFRTVRRGILDRYLNAAPGSEPLALFLLHDVIRYYRTIAVDYEYKTTEGDRPKPWGLRNVKLMFSRKLLYASGLFSIGAVAGSDPRAAAAELETLLDLPVMIRIALIGGADHASGLLRLYDRFMALLEDPAVRARLEALTLEDHDDALFREIAADGRQFSAALLRLLHSTFVPDHPIHRAMVL